MYRFVEAFVCLFRTVELPGLGVVHTLHEPLGKSVRGHRDHAVAAAAHQLERHAVVARQHDEPFGAPVEDVLHLFDVARCLLDADHVLHPASQPQRRLGRHVDARASRDVVEDHRQRRVL